MREGDIGVGWGTATFFREPSLNLLTDGEALDNRALIFGERRFFLVKNQRETK